MMDAAEYVLSEEDRLALADLAHDQLSDAVTDDGILHMIASLDAAADVQLMLSSGQELLGWLLEKPEVSGAALGELIDEVVNMKRLERAVARNDEVGCKYMPVHCAESFVAVCDCCCGCYVLMWLGHNWPAELLGWLLMGLRFLQQHFGELIDEVVNMRRLERAVARNDEVGCD
jgi:hypothetical protein